MKVGAKKVVIGGRNSKLQEEFVAALKKDQGDSYDADTQVDGSHTLDLADLQSVKEFGTYVAATYSVIDVLICNAGVMNTPADGQETKEGLERQMGVNCIGHFLLAKSCWPTKPSGKSGLRRMDTSSTVVRALISTPCATFLLTTTATTTTMDSVPISRANWAIFYWRKSFKSATNPRSKPSRSIPESFTRHSSATRVSFRRSKSPFP